MRSTQARRVWEEISGGVTSLQLGDRRGQLARLRGRFNFAGQDQQKKVGMLSGGERNRLHMAKMLKSGGNVILLDEPSNDLDVNTLRALEDALEGFAGCVLVISHDRWFLDRIATHILAFEGDSQVFFFPGNYSEYEEDRHRRLGPSPTARTASPIASCGGRNGQTSFVTRHASRVTRQARQSRVTSDE
jgi:sulfate-transporting ATPase